MKRYDVLIVGAGVSGSSLLYVLKNYTNIKTVGIIEKYSGIGMVNSFKNNNSQTLHFGDIETNYTVSKAENVKRSADFVKNYLLKKDLSKKSYSKYHKMVLAVGKSQVEELRGRYKDFKKLFPGIKLIQGEEIGKLEPNVMRGRDSKEEVLGLFSEDGYTVDFGELAKSFVKNSNISNTDRFFGDKVEEIKKVDGGYNVYIEGREFFAKVVLVAAGAHSLLMAKELGYGKDFSILSVAGSFYLAPKSLNGKVYTMQMKKLPFAAIHGDPDVHRKNETRFGPTAKAIPFLERHKWSTVFEYFKTSGIGIRTNLSIISIFSDKTIRNYIFKNLFYDFPILGKWMFSKEVRKIVPKIKASDLKYAKGYGGVRPQIVNLKTRSLDMGEAKILGDNIIFNITPSPGASTCLGNAHEDVKRVVGFLGGKNKFNEKKFLKDLG